MPKLRFDKIAFVGGRNVNQLGPIKDVIFFFELIKGFAAGSLDPVDSSLILDRLYRRYLRIEDTPQAIKAMETIAHCFASVLTSSIDWHASGFDGRPTSFRLEAETLADVTLHYFQYFEQCASSAIYCVTGSRFHLFRPVMISRSDFGSLDLARNRPLEEYDTLDGPPFWLD